MASSLRKECKFTRSKAIMTTPPQSLRYNNLALMNGDLRFPYQKQPGGATKRY